MEKLGDKGPVTIFVQHNRCLFLFFQFLTCACHIRLYRRRPWKQRGLFTCMYFSIWLNQRRRSCFCVSSIEIGCTYLIWLEALVQRNLIVCLLFSLENSTPSRNWVSSLSVSSSPLTGRQPTACTTCVSSCRVSDVRLVRQEHSTYSDPIVAIDLPETATGLLRRRNRCAI